MKKICDILIALFSIGIIISLVIIGMRYGSNAKKEKELSTIVSEFKKADIQEGEYAIEEVETEYKGYKVIGFIKIPKINIEYPILEKTTNETMKLSITKFFGNGVNDIGNLTLAGHSYYDGTMFGKTRQLEIGDTIELTDMTKATKQYKIYDKFTTDPNDVSVIEADEFGTREVTLITCTNASKDRLIIKAREN